MNDRIPATRAVIEQGIAAGLHIGAQVYVSIHAQPVADLAFGQSRPGVPMTPDTLMLWLSGSKPVGAVAIAQLWEQGKLGLDDPVARHIPEFAQNGKESITIRHILTHTAGFRWVETGWPTESWEQIIARICQAPRGARLGSREEGRLQPVHKLVHPRRDRPPARWPGLRPVRPRRGFPAAGNARFVDRDACRALSRLRPSDRGHAEDGEGRRPERRRARHRAVRRGKPPRRRRARPGTRAGAVL